MADSRRRGRAAPEPPESVWLDELDRHGVPTADPLLAQYELTDSPAKVRAMFLDAGFRDAASRVLAWSDRPTLAEFVARHATWVLGVDGSPSWRTGDEISS